MRLDIKGKRFGKLVAIEPAGKRSKDGLVVWRCKCDCGNEVEVVGSLLAKGNTRSCGCLRRTKISVDLAGQRFGKLTVMERTEKRSKERVVWKCRCDCGNMTEATTSELRSGGKKSCGCLVAETLRKDLAGRRFGRLVAVRPVGHKGRSILWECKCDCGNAKRATTNQLTGGKVRSCGCLRNGRTSATDTPAKTPGPRVGDIAGKRFGKLTAVEPTGGRYRNSPVWRCVCECGAICEVPRSRLVGGSATSCGCE